MSSTLLVVALTYASLGTLLVVALLVCYYRDRTGGR